MILSFNTKQFDGNNLSWKTVNVINKTGWNLRLNKVLEIYVRKKRLFFYLNIINIMNVYVIFFFFSPRRFTCFWYISLISLVYHSGVGNFGYFEDYFRFYLGVCDERCWCVHKYRCYYWNINICLLEIISRPRSKNVSGRYISKYLLFWWWINAPGT